MSATLPTPDPPVEAATQAFWDATAERRLLLPRCEGCLGVFWPPRASCPACGSGGIAWREATGHGRIYSYTVVRRGGGAYRDAGPYVLAYVELDEGPRVLTNIVDHDGEELRVGTRVEVVFHDTGTGKALPRFRPVVG